MIQDVTIHLPGQVRLSDTYVYPTNSASMLTQLLTVTITSGSGRDRLMGELNARDTGWDKMNNGRGRVLTQRIVGTRHTIIAPQRPTYKERWRKGASSPDLVLTNMRGGHYKCYIQGRGSDRRTTYRSRSI